jgi:hypothetical protein
MEVDYLFPLLCDSGSQTADWWAIRSFAHLAQRVEAINWLSKYDAGHWVTYVVMHDFLDIKVIQHLHNQKLSHADIQRRIAAFFYKNDKQSSISTIPCESTLHHL